MDATASKPTVIRDNFQQVVDRISKCARSAGRNPEDIRLVVVTKTQPVDVVRILIEAGATDFGENYLDEAVPKIQALTRSRAIHWHMIGHVQSRKAQSVCEYFDFVHSLDSVKLAGRLDQFARELGKSLPMWMEFNVSGEESKFGWNISEEQNWKSIIQDVEKIFKLPNLDFRGVMTVPPYSSNPESSRPYYKQLRKFQEYVISRLHVPDFHELSMGMSSDFEVAIEEGSTCVRIGQAILGPRSA